MGARAAAPAGARARFRGLARGRVARACTPVRHTVPPAELTPSFARPTRRIRSIDQQQKEADARVKDNVEKIKLNKALPYMVANVIEVRAGRRRAPAAPPSP